MKKQAFMTLIYSLFILVGGVIGFVVAHSNASLLMGTLFFFCLMLSSIAMYKGYILGFLSAILLTVILSIFFSYRFIDSYRFIPSGMMALLSLFELIFLLTSKNHALDQIKQA